MPSLGGRHQGNTALRRSTDRILTTHVGSLPDPEGLGRHRDGDVVRGRVEDIVRQQREIGLDIINEGEWTKGGDWLSYVEERFSGFEPRPPKDLPVLLQGKDRAEFADFYRYATERGTLYYTPGEAKKRSGRPHWACTGPIVYRGTAALKREIEAFAAVVDPAEAFLTSTSPASLEPYRENEFYQSEEEFVYAIAEAMRVEYETIARAGLVLQIDCPDLGMGRHIQHADLSLPEWRKKAALHVEVLNHALRNIAPTQLRMHLCWGNYEGPHHCDVPLADVIDIVFRARPSAIALEAANPRHAHEWQLFESVKLPEGKMLIPGVIESKSNFVEHPELVAQRIGRYANLVGRENVMAGSDCGYGTWVGQAAVDPDVVWAKFAAMAEGARIASARFWRR